MTDPRLDYVGPLPNALTYQGKPTPWWKRIPWPFFVVVVVPTVLAAIYFLLIASDQYVSESRFVVRSTGGGGAPSAFGVALQGVGISAGQTDAFAVHEYITSLDGLSDLGQRFDVAAMLGPQNADPFARYPRLGESRSAEGLQKALNRFVTVGYDSTTGISTLRVKAFSATDAQQINSALLDGGEALVNRLNARSVTDALADARAQQERATARLADVQQQMTNFRNREQFIDPSLTAAESSQLIGSLLAAVAELRAERSQIASEAPASPRLPSIDSRIAAIESQIVAERNKIAGQSSSLAPQVGAYEELILNREIATRELTQVTAQLLAAEQEARRQQLYLERVVSPSLPQEALEPRRWLAIITVLMTTLLAYGIGWLVWAGVREHRQA